MEYSGQLGGGAGPVKLLLKFESFVHFPGLKFGGFLGAFVLCSFVKLWPGTWAPRKSSADFLPRVHQSGGKRLKQRRRDSTRRRSEGGLWAAAFFGFWRESLHLWSDKWGVKLDLNHEFIPEWQNNPHLVEFKVFKKVIRLFLFDCDRFVPWADFILPVFRFAVVFDLRL